MNTKKGYKISEEHKRKISESMKGKKNASKGERIVSSQGYILIRVKGKYIPEHRMIMEEYLGTKLRPNEIVHHINNIKTDNKISNLSVVSGSTNSKEYHALARKAIEFYVEHH